jgi:2-oxoisovalerate dehydrogenase E2 component (dihydrolipoyl transacylase)
VRRAFTTASDEVTETRVIGLRRKIAERLEESARRIPHIAYVDEVDLTLLQQLRDSINADESRPKLTLLPFLVRALVAAVAAHPQFNAHFDDDAGVLRSFAAVHVGIATQTESGLVVPVVRHAEALDLFAIGAEIERLATAARDGSATAEELSGSTITITSLGALGGLVSTPIINRPEVAIIGVNKLQVRPVWDGHAFAPRTMMNLSSSFDHRIIDGWDAARFIQRVRMQLESPAGLLLGDA